MMKLYENIKKLVQYGINTGLTPECERIYTTNLLLDLFQENDYEDSTCDLSKIVLEDVLKELLDEACSRGIIEDSVVHRDLFDTKLMNCLMPRPAQVQKSFWEDYAVSPEHATEKYYKFSRQRLYPPLPYQKGPEVDGGYGLRHTGHHHQSVQAGKGPEGNSRCQERKEFRLSEMPALYGK